MTSLSTSLKVAAIFEIIVAAISGSVFPFIYVKFMKDDEDLDGPRKVSRASHPGHGSNKNDLDSQPLFFMLKALSCGIIVGVAVLHLLPDADESLAEEYDYPVSFATCCLGIMLCLVCEQFAMWIATDVGAKDEYHERREMLSGEALLGRLMSGVDTGSSYNQSSYFGSEMDFDHSHAAHHVAVKPSNSRELDHAHEHQHAHGHEHGHDHGSCQSSPSAATNSMGHDHAHGLASPPSGDIHTQRSHASVSGARRTRYESNCEMGMAVHVFANANDARSLLKAYVLECAIAVHSVIMGLSLGAMDDSDITNIKVLMVAYGIHQLLEGVSLGCAISATRLSFNKIAGLVGFFACTLPFGIILGLLISSSTESSTGELVKGYANGIAAGILIYVGMVEMMADEFSHALVVNDYGLKAKMALLLGFGMGTMALLATWA
jgi:zinc transporter ZupT